MIRGWKFPIEIDAQSGMFKTVKGDEDIKEAIRIILTTKRGERIGNPQFGSRLFDFMFASFTYTELKELEYEIIDALNRWEPRIRDLEVEAQTDVANKGKIIVTIQYRTDQSMTPEEFSFQFETNEGINF